LSLGFRVLVLGFRVYKEGSGSRDGATDAREFAARVQLCTKVQGLETVRPTHASLQRVFNSVRCDVVRTRQGTGAGGSFEQRRRRRRLGWRMGVRGGEQGGTSRERRPHHRAVAAGT